MLSNSPTIAAIAYVYLVGVLLISLAATIDKMEGRRTPTVQRLVNVAVAWPVYALSAFVYSFFWPIIKLLIWPVIGRAHRYIQNRRVPKARVVSLDLEQVLGRSQRLGQQTQPVKMVVLTIDKQK